MAQLVYWEQWRTLEGHTERENKGTVHDCTLQHIMIMDNTLENMKDMENCRTKNIIIIIMICIETSTQYNNYYYRPYILLMFLFKRTFRDGLYGTSPRRWPYLNTKTQNTDLNTTSVQTLRLSQWICLRSTKAAAGIGKIYISFYHNHEYGILHSPPSTTS